MTSGYIVPAMLKNLAPLGIDWDSIPDQNASEQANLAALLDICHIASDAIDTECFQPLRSTVDIEELVGPGGDRLVVPPAGNGNAIAMMQHWPITAVLGAQISAASTFPPQWQAIAAKSLWVGQGSLQFVGGALQGSSGSDGMNIIEMQPGYITWGNGRGGYRAQYAYQSGWPTAGLLPSATFAGTLSYTSETITDVTTDASEIPVGSPITGSGIPDGTTVISSTTNTITLSTPATEDVSGGALYIGYLAGVLQLNVDDVTGMLSYGPTIYDGSFSEGVRVQAIAASDPITVLPGIEAQIGPGVITLSSPTRWPHVGGEPATVLVSAMPSVVRLAAYYFAGAEALQRGSTSYTVQSLPGSVSSGGGTPSIGVFTKMAENLLGNFHRAF